MNSKLLALIALSTVVCDASAAWKDPETFGPPAPWQEGASKPGLEKRVHQIERQLRELHGEKAARAAVPAIDAERTVAEKSVSSDAAALSCREDETRGMVRSFSAKTYRGTLLTDAGENVPVSDYGITFLPPVLKRGEVVCFRVTRDHHGATNLNPIAIKVRLAQKAEPKPACPRGSHLGHVKRYSDAKGHGFLEDAATREEVFVQFSAILTEGYKTFAEGEPVCFVPVQGPKGYQDSNLPRLALMEPSSGGRRSPSPAR